MGAGLHRAAQVGFLCAQICGKTFRNLPLQKHKYVGKGLEIYHCRSTNMWENVSKFTIAEAQICGKTFRNLPLPKHKYMGKCLEI